MILSYSKMGTVLCNKTAIQDTLPIPELTLISVSPMAHVAEHGSNSTVEGKNGADEWNNDSENWKALDIVCIPAWNPPNSMPPLIYSILKIPFLSLI